MALPGWWDGALRLRHLDNNDVKKQQSRILNLLLWLTENKLAVNSNFRGWWTCAGPRGRSKNTWVGDAGRERVMPGTTSCYVTACFNTNAVRRAFLQVLVSTRCNQQKWLLLLSLKVREEIQRKHKNVGLWSKYAFQTSFLISVGSTLLYSSTDFLYTNERFCIVVRTK